MSLPLYLVLAFALLALAVYEQVLPWLHLRRMARKFAQEQKEQQS